MFTNNCCCCNCSNSDVLILIDTTGSMGPFITGLQAIVTNFRVDFESDTCLWAVADYKDYEDLGDYSAGWSVKQEFTSDFDLIVAAVGGLAAAGGGDVPEQNFAALSNAPAQWTAIGGRAADPSIRRLVIWGGDAPGWNGAPLLKGGLVYPTRSATIAALIAEDIAVYGLNVRAAGDGIDGLAGLDGLGGQATAITSATGGNLWNDIDGSDSTEIHDAFCEILAG